MAKSTFAFISLGCPKNLVDSERMLGKLAQDGLTLVPDADGADVVVVNTCGFIEPARQESLGVIREMLALKEQGKVGAVVVAGCLVERKKDELLEEVPGVDALVSVFGREEIVEAVRSQPSAVRNKGIESSGGLQTLTVPQQTKKGKQRTADGGPRTLIEEEITTIFRPAPVRALEDTARLRRSEEHTSELQ